MISSEYDNDENALHQFITFTYIPLNGQNIMLPHQNPTGMIHVGGGYVMVDGNLVFNTGSITYNFAAGGNTLPDFNLNPPVGTANYTGLATGANKEAELFWEGDYYYIETNLTGAKGKSAKSLSINDFKSISKVQINQIKNLKTIK